MEEKKKSKKIVWIISAIIILILGIVGYIVYDNFLKVDKTVPNHNNNTTTTTTEMIKKEEKFTKYPENNDENIISFNLHELYVNEYVDLKKDFQNLKLKKENIDYTLSCSQYDEDHIEAFGYACSHFEILINKIKLEDYFNEGCGHTKHIIIIDDYLIMQYSEGCDSGCGYIKIFKNSELIYTIKGTTTYINDSYDNDMKYYDDKLYYFTQTKDNYGAYNVLKTVDLNGTEVVETEIERKATNYAVCYDLSGEFED